MFKFFCKISDERDTALALYSEAIRQARTPLFYEQCGVADTPDGRFDMIMVHVYLVLRRLKGGDERCKVLAQTLFDIMFDDMDQNLREMGAGDIGVAYRVKDMVKAFYGRIAAYDEGLEDTGGDLLEAALRRNLYRNIDPVPDQLSVMAEYVREQDGELAAQAIDGFLAGSVHFSLPPVIGDAS